MSQCVGHKDDMYMYSSWNIKTETKSGELLSQYHLNDIPNIAINVENAPELSFLKISSFNVAGYPYTTVRRYRFSWKQLV